MKEDKSKNQPTKKVSSSKEDKKSNKMYVAKIILGEGKYKIETHIALTSPHEDILLRDPRGIFGVEAHKVKSSGNPYLDVYDNM